MKPSVESSASPARETAMTTPPATATPVPRHQRIEGAFFFQRTLMIPAQIGALPIVTADPKAMPISRTPAKNPKL